MGHRRAIITALAVLLAIIAVLGLVKLLSLISNYLPRRAFYGG